MIRFVPLTEELLAWAMAEGLDADAPRVMPDEVMLRTFMSSAGPKIAMLGDGRVLGAGGVIRHWTGRGEAWLMLSRLATPRQRVLALRRCRQEIEALQADPAWRRIEMNVLAAAPWCARFAGYLGFRAEALQEAWDPSGRDFYLFSRVAAVA